jgi:hypothetical protein
MIPSTYISSASAANARHEGIERVAAGFSTIGNAVAHTSARKAISRGVVGIGTMAAITLAERTLDQSHAGFTAELVILSVVAVLAYVALRSFVVPALRVASSGLRTLSARLKRQAEEEKFMESARRDPRIMNDLLAAQGSHERFVDEQAFRSASNATAAGVRDPLEVGVAPWRAHANLM